MVTASRLDASIVIMHFEESLYKEDFDSLVKLMFAPDSSFGLWGNPIRLGPRKIHVYGVDKNVWKSIFIELTDRHLVILGPEGVCEDTVNRLADHIRKHVNPEVKFYVSGIGHNI